MSYAQISFGRHCPEQRSNSIRAILQSKYQNTHRCLTGIMTEVALLIRLEGT